MREKVARLVKEGNKGQAEKFQKQLDQLLAHIEKLRSASQVENYDTGSIFDWSVEFAEVFEDGGFDIVLANPPYVQQEEIDKDVKKRLLELYSEAMTGKSDLFVAFYARGLQLLKDGGTHVFVCSNSWLDVKYGGKLQSYLLNNSHVAAIYDSAIERQFASADINTIISFIYKKEPDDDDITQFVSLRAPFLEALADATKRRVLTKTSAEIWENGSDLNNEYEGDKWGGRYLRAPDIYFTILEKGRDKLVPLGSVVTVNEGRPTGANDFFYVQHAIAEEFQIEDEFLYPGLMKTRGFNRFDIRSDHLDRYFLSVDCPKHELKQKKVLDYIDKGESDGLNDRKTFAKKTEWYRFRVRAIAELVSPCGIGSTFFCARNTASAVASNSYTEFRVNDEGDTILLWGILNSVLVWFQLEILGRSSLGGGMLKVDPIEYRSLRVPELTLLEPKRNRIEEIFEILKERTVGSLNQEVSSSDRRELDNIIFDALGLTTGERDAVYEAVIGLVSKRLQRAQTVTN
ncbi:MAG: Eco57I restriction-modification methylase domain-containing protein [Acidobacteria bacterium]|nr:Eco57I restriction-modification methylase domain-containing protein [Acidobacteriota bacterium]